jgi:uncharacterized sulfatase
MAWPACVLVLSMAIAAGCGPSSSEPARPPNVIYLISDDQGFGDYGFMGSEIVQTPNLDRLAEEGVVFTTARNTSSVCRPSLVTLLTGLEPMQWQLEVMMYRVAGAGRKQPTLPKGLPTLPRLLAEQGYASFQGGKYWEGAYQNAGFTAGMTNEPTGGILSQAGNEGLELGRRTMEPLYDFIDERGEEPFFIWFAPFIPHIPHIAPKHHRETYRGRQLSIATRNYYAMCSWYDELVGELIAHLERRGLRENTLLIFLSDNGWESVPLAGAKSRIVVQTLGGSRGKMSMHELGFRTPIVMSWPRGLEGGRRLDDLVSTLDVVPTVLDFAGVAAPPGLIGRSLRPMMDDGARSHWEMLISTELDPRPGPEVERQREAKGEPPLETVPGRAYSVRSVEWSSIHYTGQAHDTGQAYDELYRIREDPDEQVNVAGQHPEIVARMRHAAVDYRTDLLEPYFERIRSETPGPPELLEPFVECVVQDRPAKECRKVLYDAKQAGLGADG